MRLHRDLKQTLYHPNISPHISHAMRAEKRAAAPSTSTSSTSSSSPSLSCWVLARPWANVPFSHTPAGRTWCPASSIIPGANCFNKDHSAGCSLSRAAVVLRRAGMKTDVLFFKYFTLKMKRNEMLNQVHLSVMMN